MRRIGMAVLGLAIVGSNLYGQRSALREVHDRGTFGVTLAVAEPLGEFRNNANLAGGITGYALTGGRTLGLRIEGSWIPYASDYQGYDFSTTSQIAELGPSGFMASRRLVDRCSGARPIPAAGATAATITWMATSRRRHRGAAAFRSPFPSGARPSSSISACAECITTASSTSRRAACRKTRTARSARSASRRRWTCVYGKSGCRSGFGNLACRPPPHPQPPLHVVERGPLFKAVGLFPGSDSGNAAGVLTHHIPDHREQRELALWRERCLRLVQQIQATGHKPRLKELEKTLTV